MSNTRPDLKLVVAFVGLWAAEEALTALVIGRYGLAQIVWLRFALHLLLLVAVFGWNDPASLWRTRRPVAQLLRASMMVVMPGCWLLGVERGLSPATMMSVFWLAPLMILGLARAFLRERVSHGVWIASAVACGGVFALTGPHAMPRLQLLAFPIGMALSFSVFVVMSRSLRAETLRSSLFYIGLGVCALLAPLIPLQWAAPGPMDMLIHLGIAVLGLGGLLALLRLTALSSVSDAAPLAYLQIPFAVAFGWSIEEHDPVLRTLIGLLVIVAVACYVWRRAPHRVPAPLLGDTTHGLDTGHGSLDTGHGSFDTRP
jgi:drug/metabolite transporter (DMT)-like permease